MQTIGTNAAPPVGGRDFGSLERALASRTGQLVWFCAFALLTRVSAFGDTNIFADELFYLQIGQRMHEGLLPYVDLWDRKGPGLFALYWLIAAIPGSLIGYQVVACLFAIATATAIQRIAETYARPFAATLAATFYIIMLPLFGGIGGQAQVLYNLFIALAALLVLRGQLVRAMALAGLAISFKSTALVEGAALGFWGLWQLRRETVRSLAALALRMAIAGAAPMLIFASFFLATGHFAEFWHAMVTSNVTRIYNPGGDALTRIGALALLSSPLLVLAAAGLVLPVRQGAPAGFLRVWIAAAVIAFAAVPNFLDHYMLPVLVPLSVIAAIPMDARRVGALCGICLMFLTLLVSPSFWFEGRRQSRAQMEQLAATVQRHGARPRLLVYQGPVYLYTMVGRFPPSPLFLPYHLIAASEDNTSWMDTAAEMRRILAWHPQVVVTDKDLHGGSGNLRTLALVEDYVKTCRKWSEQNVTYLYGKETVVVYGDCGIAPSAGGPATGR